MKGKKRSRKLLAAVIVLIFGCAGLWAGGWYFFAGQIEGQGRELLHREAAWGRDWQCAQLQRRGFPFNISYECLTPVMHSELGAMGRLAGLNAHWGFGAPLRVNIAAQGPLDLTLPDKTTAHMSWQSAQALVRFTLGGLYAQLNLDAPQLELGGTASSEHSAKAILVDAGPVSSSAPLPFSFRAEGARSPLVADILRDPAPLDLSCQAEIVNPQALQGGNLPAQLERWRSGGGALTIRSCHGAAGDLNVDASGSLTLDDQHRLDGMLQLHLRGAGHLLEQYGLGPKSGLVGGLLGSFFKNSSQGVSLPLHLSGGKVMLGPVRLPFELLPLY